MSSQFSVLGPPSFDVVTRFAPSPTGRLHLGNARTALLNWLFARRHGGCFLLRIEDTDLERSREAHVAAIVEDLCWLGLDWDGEPVLQSKHADAHRRALEALAACGAAYRCFCSTRRLELERRWAVSRGLPPRYSGRCRLLPPEEAERRARTHPHVWRLAVHADEGEVRIHDLLRGEVRFARRDLDDPIVRRSNGRFTFLLPNAVDDADQGVTHVLRGDDHLSNSAYQVWLLQRLDRTPPAYLHHGLLLAADGSKLSKRSGAAAISDLRRAGVLPQAIVQALVRLGHPNIPDDALDLPALARRFQPRMLSTAAVRWSDTEMRRWQAKLLHAMPAAELASLLRPLFPDAGVERLQAFAALVRDNLERIEDARRYCRLLKVQASPQAEAMAAAAEAGTDFFRHALELWRGGKGDWRAWSAALAQATGKKGRDLYLPLRAALSGEVHGPEMGRMVAFLGRDGVEVRLCDIIRRLS